LCHTFLLTFCSFACLVLSFETNSLWFNSHTVSGISQTKGKMTIFFRCASIINKHNVFWCYDFSVLYKIETFVFKSICHTCDQNIPIHKILSKIRCKHKTSLRLKIRERKYFTTKDQRRQRLLYFNYCLETFAIWMECFATAINHWNRRLAYLYSWRMNLRKVVCTCVSGLWLPNKDKAGIYSSTLFPPSVLHSVGFVTVKIRQYPQRHFKFNKPVLSSS
jgi:hypothetical protein